MVAFLGDVVDVVGDSHELLGEGAARAAHAFRRVLVSVRRLVLDERESAARARRRGLAVVQELAEVHELLVAQVGRELRGSLQDLDGVVWVGAELRERDAVRVPRVRAIGNERARPAKVGQSLPHPVHREVLVAGVDEILQRAPAADAARVVGAPSAAT